MKNQIWIAVDQDGQEAIYTDKPFRQDNAWSFTTGRFIDVPNNTAFKLTGRRLTWEHEAVCIKF